jgi:signal transduction histidine kinase
MCVDLHQAARPWVALPVVLVAGGSLAWRLRAPQVPVLLIGATNLWLLATAPGEFGPQTVVIGLLVAVYSAAAHLSGRRAAAVGVAALVLMWAAHASTRDGDLADFFPALEWGVPWLAGRLVRRQTMQAREAGARATLAELQARDAVNQERDRIARELHDVVAHAVSLMVVQAGAERLSSDVSDRTRNAFGSIEAVGRQALVELRTMLGVLRDTGGGEPLAPMPDLRSLPALVESVRSAGLDVRLDVVGDEEVPQGVGLAAYRVVQEALTNALRHGTGDAQVQVTVDRDVRVHVRNAIGSSDGQAGAGRGLLGMRERVALFSGEVDARRDGPDWVVDARIPLDRRQLA